MNETSFSIFNRENIFEYNHLTTEKNKKIENKIKIEKRSERRLIDDNISFSNFDEKKSYDNKEEVETISKEIKEEKFECQKNKNIYQREINSLMYNGQSKNIPISENGLFDLNGRRKIINDDYSVFENNNSSLINNLSSNTCQEKEKNEEIFFCEYFTNSNFNLKSNEKTSTNDNSINISNNLFNSNSNNYFNLKEQKKYEGIFFKFKKVYLFIFR